MNENLNLVEILKDCPSGTKLYSTVSGEVELDYVEDGAEYPINIIAKYGVDRFTSDGRQFIEYDGECLLFPSREQRDWSKFTAPWYKKERFDPKTLQAFDRVLVRNENYQVWQCDLFSHIKNGGIQFMYRCVSSSHKCCIPYNDDTKHLIGTNEEAPEFYRYWED